MLKSTYAAIGATALAGLFLAGCSGSLSLTADEVATDIMEGLRPEVREFVEVECPGSLEGEVGTTMTCTLFDDDLGEEFDVYVEVTSIEGNTINFTAVPSDDPN